jgi:transposase-like protein
MAKNTRYGKSLISLQQELGTEKQCLAFLEALRWPDGVRCVECGHDKVSKFVAKGRLRVDRKGEEVRSPDRHLYQCLKCDLQFTATAGTLFNDSHLPLQKWMQAVAIMCNAKKGVSARQLWRDLGVSYKTAWYLAHRIREAMALGNFNDQKMSGTVEMDETYIGGKYDKRRKRARWDKEAVFGVIERETGRVHAKHLPGRNHINSWQVGNEIDAVVDPSAQMMTDESRLYANLERRGFKHEIVIHSDKEWIRGDCHTQSIDSFWGLLKRGVVGTYHQLSIKHLDRYITEFSYRWNNRQNQELFAVTVACLVFGIPLPYAKLIAKSSEQTSVSDSDVPF